ncbi:uncharacterized protein LOC144617504 isoform X2 [Crassostrea virginica]
MISPVKFSKHWEVTSEEWCVLFENDKELLTIEEIVSSGEYRAIEIPYNSIHDAVVVYPEQEETSLFINIKSNPKLFTREKKKFGIEEKRIVSLPDVRRESFGRSSSFCVRWSGNLLDNANNETNGWDVIFRLKRLGYHVVYARVSSMHYSPRASTFSFNDFDMEYAWACLCSQGYKVTDQLDEDNILLLKRSETTIVPEMLHRIAVIANERPFINFPCLIAKEVNTNKTILSENEDLPPNYSLIRRMVLTPTKHVFYPKEPIVQNRIIRQYEEEYFIRIVFRDEDYERVSAIQPNSLDAVIEAMKQFMQKGFHILDRKYEFLGCSNSQLREHGFWLFCPNNGINAQNIRDDCGDISSERCVASYVSRFGLCFSASRDTIDVGVRPGEEVFEDDIERNEYCFSDGIGKISPCLASKVTKSLGLKVIPSAFQIRFGGCKGVVSQDPNIDYEKDVLVIRNSMKKFNSTSKKLEILQVTNPGRLHLNRQVITLLSGLGVSDNVFLSLQEDMLFSLADMMMYDKEAIKALSGLSLNLKLKELQRRGIIFVREPFFRSLLITVYKCKIRDLMRKARIQLPFEKGRIMMGTLDDTGQLEYGEVFVQYSEIPGQQQQDTIIHTGPVVATKNPCFHPGDLRKFQAVDVPALHHMFDCIVFPQKGSRPHPNEMSGSDLDGDMYFVSWDKQFCDIVENEPPMEFPKAEKLKLSRNVEVEDIIDFVGEYIKNDNLGIIANAHVVHADLKDIFTDTCKQLAKMHSDAVDFPKTGKPAKMQRDLRVEKYPDFMQKTDKPQYLSIKILGKLFRQCRALEQAQTRRRDHTKNIRSVVPDCDLFLKGWEKYKDDAIVTRNTYNDKLRQLLILYGIENETEAITGTIRRLDPKRGCLQNEKYEVGQIIKAKMSVVWKRTREEFFKEFGGESKIDFECCENGVLLKASAWYIVTYSKDPENPEPLLSFPWIISDIIALVKSDKREERVEVLPREMVGEDEKDNDNLFQIGSSIVRRFFSTKNLRRETVVNLKMVRRTVLDSLVTLKEETFIPMGTSLLGLMKVEEKTIEIYVNTSKNKRKAFHSIQDMLYRQSINIVKRGFHPEYKVMLNHNLYFVRFSADVNMFRKSMFLTNFVHKNRELAPVIMFLLDWGRKTYIISGARSMFDEITFSMIIIGCLLSMDNLPDLQISYPKSVDPKTLDLDTLDSVDLGDISRSRQKLLAQIVMFFFREYRNILANNLKDGVLTFIADPSHKTGKNLLNTCTPLNQSNTTALLNEMLCAYQELAEKNTIDNFFGDAGVDEERLVLNLPLDTWDSLMFAEAYIERQLSKATGADIRIRRTNFRETKGIILEAWGNYEQLWKVNKSLQDLGDKSAKFVSTSARDKAFVEGAYMTIFEGCRSTNDMLSFQSYSGPIQEHHKHRSSVHLPCLQGVVRHLEPSIEHLNDNDPDCQIFQKIFIDQINVVREYYDETYHGVLRLAMTFGNVYLVDVDNRSMSIKDLQEKLHRTHFVERKEYHSTNQKNYSRGRRGRGRGGSSYSNLRGSLSAAARRRISSSFIPSNCNAVKVEQFLQEFGFQKNGKENKYHVSLQTGEADFGKPHTGLCVLDRDMTFIEFRLADLKWLAGDVIRLRTDENKTTLNVRCKLQSRRILEVETIRKMSDLKVVLDQNYRLMTKTGDVLHVSSEFKDRVTFVREKQVNSYSYLREDDESIWNNMKIYVDLVTEYSGYNRILGTFSESVQRTEVTMIPKMPDIHSSDEDLKTYAKRTWNLALFLGSQFE